MKTERKHGKIVSGVFYRQKLRLLSRQREEEKEALCIHVFPWTLLANYFYMIFSASVTLLKIGVYFTMSYITSILFHQIVML